MLLPLILVSVSACSNADSSPVRAKAEETDESELLLELIKKNSLRKGSHYVSEVKIKDVNNTIETWVMGNKVKSAVINNNKATVVINDGTYMITYVSDEKTGIRMKLDGTEGFQEFFDPENDIMAGSLKIEGNEERDGISCIVATAKHSFYGTEFRLWVDKSNGFIIRREGVSVNGEPLVAVCRDISFGPVDESVFSVPPGIDIQEL